MKKKEERGLGARRKAGGKGFEGFELSWVGLSCDFEMWGIFLPL